mgnify:CR=1 FL=1
MQSIELIRVNLKRSQEIVLSRIDDMREHALVAPTPQGGCHTLWVLGHLAFIESLLIHQFMQGQPNPLEAWEEMFDGAEVISDPARLVSFDVALQQCQTARAATIALLDTLDEVALDQASAAAPPGSADLFGTYRHCFQYAADHWFMHRGQLADARRAAGVEKMWF